VTATPSIQNRLFIDGEFTDADGGGRIPVLNPHDGSVITGTPYDLGGGLWTRDLQRAHRIAAAMRTGMVWINCYKRVNPGSPFAGVASSGYGREMGFEAMHDYTEAKSVWVNVDAKIPPNYPRG
jgi:aldehyde dehydrogenase (NAD+)